MKVIHSILKQFIELPNDPHKIEEILVTLGHEVENIEKINNDNIVIGAIKKISKHPSADRLLTTDVSIGSKNLTVVTGATNINVGDKVPVAQIGVELPNGLKIEKRNLRGVDSEGMLCSGQELKISQSAGLLFERPRLVGRVENSIDSEGILILPTRAKVGETLSTIFPNDYIYDLEITPNRGDCLSHLGIACEIGAFINKIPNLDLKKEKFIPQFKTSRKAIVRNSILCPQYNFIEIRNVKISQSPEWLKIFLEKIGLRPINNIVDFINYIMFLYGQPMHAFDADKIHRNIIVDTAHERKKIETLDNLTHKLDEKMLMIRDEKKALAIAGIIGSKNSAVSDSTKNIILESAIFDPISIRKTRKKLNISTDSSYRFERGIDPEMTQKIIKFAAGFIANNWSGKASGLVSIGKKRNHKKIKFSYKKINDLIGANYTPKNIFKTLEKLGINCESCDTKKTECVVEIPSWRYDLNIEADLAEEVARLNEYKKIPSKKMAARSIDNSKTDFNFIQSLKDMLVENGFTEILSYSFYGKNEKISTNKSLEIANPISPGTKIMRQSLLPGALKCIARNPEYDPIKIFEIGRVFGSQSENENLIIVWAGKGIDEFVNNIKKISIHQKIKFTDAKILKKFKIRKPSVAYVELNAADLKEFNKNYTYAKIKERKIFREISKFQATVFDVSLIANKRIFPSKIEKIISKNPFVTNVELFDKFSHEKLGKENISYAFHVTIESSDRNLTSAEITDISKSIINYLAKHNIKIRR